MRAGGRGSFAALLVAAAADRDEREPRPRSRPRRPCSWLPACSASPPRRPCGRAAGQYYRRASVLARRARSPAGARCSRSQERSSASSYSRPCELAQVVAVLVPRLLLGAGTGAVLSGGGRGHSVPPLRPGTLCDCTPLRGRVARARGPQRAVHAVRADAYICSRGPGSPACDRGVPRRRHRDQRPRGRRVRAHRDRRGARRRRRAARPLGDAAVGRAAPLSRGIQRFTGITQAMVDEAPPAEAMLPELAEQLHGRVLVAHSAGFDRRVLRQAFARAGIAVAEPAGRCARSRSRGASHPLARQRAPAAAGASRSASTSRSRTARSPTPRRARACSARCSARLCAQRDDDRRGARAAAPGAAAPRARAGDDGRRGARCAARAGAGPDLGGLPDEPGVYVFRNAAGQPLYVGKSVSVRTRARAHFAPSSAAAAWAPQAETVDTESTRSELGALRAREPADQASCARPATCASSTTTATSTCAAASTSRSRCSRSRPSPRAGPRGERRAAARPRVWRSSWSSSSTRCSGCATAGASCRGATSRRPTGRWGAACRRACSDLDPNLYRRAARRGARAVHRPRRRRRARCSRTSTARCARPPRDAALRARGVAAAPPRAPRGPARRASAACSRRRTRGRGSCSPSTRAAARFDAFWLVGGRVADWGPLGDARRRGRAHRGGAARRATARRAATRAARPTRSTTCGSSRTLASASRSTSPQLALDPSPDPRAGRLRARSAPIRAATRRQRRWATQLGERELDDLGA